MNILTIDGYKNILECPIGTLVKAYEVGTGNVIWNELLKVEIWDEAFVNTLNGGLPPENQIEWKWYLINGIYKIFSQQSIWNSPSTVIHAFELKVGDAFYSDTDGDLIVDTIEETTPDAVWYRLEISGDHSFIADGFTQHNANRTISIAGGLYSSTSTWDEGSVPTSADAVICRGTGDSGNLTISTAAVALSVDFTNYVNTLAINSTWTVSGSFKMVSGQASPTGTGTLIINSTTPTLTSGGKTWSGSLTIQTLNQVVTLGDNWTINGTLACGNTSNYAINGFKINLKGNLSVAGVSNLSWTTVIELNGSGTQTWFTPGGSNSINGDLIFNSTGTIIVSGGVGFRYGTLTYTQGTITVTGSTLTVTNTAKLDTSGMTWNNISSGGGQTTTLLSDLYCVNLNISPSASNNQINGFTVHITGTLTISAIGGTASGTSILSLEGGSAAINTAITGTGYLASPLTINTASVTVTGGIIYYGANTFTMNYGISGSWTLQIRANTTINANGNSIPTLTINTAGITVTLSSACIISSAFNSTVATSASKASFVSNSAGTQRKLTLQQGATQDLGFTNFTDIDASDGKTIWVWKPVLSNTNNINSLTEPKNVTSTF